MAAPTATLDESRSTLFVRNLPYSATKEQLENVFSEIGPVKNSFVVTEKGVKEKCRGFGYVTFALREDAEKSLKARLRLDNRKLFVSYSRRKEPQKGRRGVQKGGGELEEEASQDDDGSERTTAAEAEERTLGEDEVRQPHQATAAALGPKGAKGRRTRIAEEEATASQKPRPSKGGTEDKMGRLIIRNLAFNCSEKKLRKAFARFGDIAEVHIPCDPRDPKKVRGYGFVQFSNMENAAKAVKEMNAQEIMGRPIAVDWSLSRNRYLAAAKKNAPSKMEPKVDGEEEDSESDYSKEEESNEESGVESSSEMEDTRGDDDDEEEDEEDSEDEDSGSGDEDTDGEDESSSEDEGVASNEEKTKKAALKPDTKVAPSKKVTSDVDQGRTVFIRNVLFETTEEEIHELFNQFGEIMYCKLVVDKATEHSKGAAFVQFATKEGADRCLEKAKYTHEGEGLVLGGRQLLVSLALQREEASKLREVRKEKRKAEKKDKRNMYLLQEGFIRPGTKAAEGMTDADLAKRSKMESIKRMKLNNINVFVSPTRMAIHNLPKAVDQRRLKEVLLKAAGDKKAKVIECRIMRDMKTPSSEGQGKSLGFAFAEFKEHEHALAALRSLNNSTEYFGEAKRPIVGFSLENRLALEAKQRRQEKSLMKSRQIQRLQKRKEGQPGKSNADQADPKQQLSKTRQKKGGVLPPPPSSKLERRLQSKSKMTVHLGAKKRWRDRGKEVDVQKEKRREKRRQLLADSGRKEREPAKPKGKQGEAQSSRRQKKSGAEDIKFDKLVASYKHKLFSREESGRALKKSKWFEEG